MDSPSGLPRAGYMTSVSMVRVDDAGISFQAGVPRVGSTRLTVSYPTANGGSDTFVRASDNPEFPVADRPPAAASSTVTITASAAFVTQRFLV
jgi:hypothetical protein